MRFSKGFLVFFSLFFFLLFTLSFSHQAFAITYLDNANIAVDTTWTKAESPYVISGDLYIESGVALTIEPGVSVKLFEGSSIESEGSLKSLGTKEEQINFSSIYDEYGGDIINDCDQVITPENTGSGPGQCTNDKIYDNDYYIWGWGYIESYGGNVDFRNTNIYHSDEQFYISDTDSAYFDNLKYSKSHMGLAFYNSKATILNSEFSDLIDDPIMAYDGNTINAENVSFLNNGYGIDISYDSTFTGKNLLINDTRDSSGVDVYAGGHVILSDSIIENKINSYDSGIDVFGWPNQNLSTVDLLNVSLLGTEGIGIEASGNAEINISKSKINNFKSIGIEISDGAKITVDSSEISNNFIGLDDDTWIKTPMISTFEIKNSSISNNPSGGVLTWNSLIPMKATNNYWGSASGPYNAILNATGTGNSVVSGVEFIPWLTEDPTKVKPTCCSNVVFIPGIESSRLYTGGAVFENQLWEPNRNADVEKLYLYSNGQSIDKNIYTRDIIERTNVGMGVLDSNIYKSFADTMDGLVTDKKINAWEPLPYDWRMDLNKVVAEPIKLENGNTYNIIDEIIKLAESSQTGKVSIVTHSNGGLVAKTLISELKKRGQENLIDQLILVASPELGTPTAVASLLHGDEQEI